MNNPFDKESWTEQEKEIINAGGWQCSFCASINASYVTSCACGHNQDDTYENLHGRYVPRPDEEYTEQQPMGEIAAEAATEQAVEEAAAPLEEMPSAPVEPSFEELPSAPTEPTFEEMPSVPVEPSFEETSSSTNALVEESSMEENTVAEVEPAVEAATIAEPAPAAEPAIAVPPVRKPVSKTNKPMEEYTEYEQGILNDGGWECAFCERINASYITNCACGHSEDDSFMKRRGKYVDPDADETEPPAAVPQSVPVTPVGAPTVETASTATASTTTTPTAAAVQAQATAAPTPSPATPTPAALTPAEMIAEIEQELAADNSEMAKFRAIRKYKNLVKKGYMTKEEFNKKQDELLSFEEDDAMAAPESSGEDNA